MTSLQIWEDNGSGTSVLKYTPINMDSLEITKSSGVMAFPLPLVNETDTVTYSNTDIVEKIDLVAISGVTCNLSMNFWVPLIDISTLLNLVSNKASITQTIIINEWSTGGLTNFKFYGRVSDIKLSQDGGTVTRLKANLTFTIGSIVGFGEGV